MWEVADEAVMQRQWIVLLASLGADEVKAASIFRELAAHYCEPNRAYHNLRHVQQMLADAALLQSEAEDWTAVQLAIWFHDVIYQPGAADNEAQSAQFGRDVLTQLGVKPDRILTVEQLIMATKLGSTAVTSQDICIIRDVDLATLGAAPSAYDWYAQAIRREFAYVPLTDYRAGRQAILHHFLERERIYLTDAFFAKLEAQARQNISREIARLSLFKPE